MRDVAVAIHEAHRLGIVHRDLKPANIMVERSDDGRPVPIVMDFGLAREATLEVGITEIGRALGTPAYMSPEQARGDIRAVDRRSDVYSLGATLYELLAGKPPVRQRVAGDRAGAGDPRRRAGAAQPGADAAARSRDHRAQVSGQGSRCSATRRRAPSPTIWRASSTASRSSAAARRCCSGSRAARAATARCSRSAPGRRVIILALGVFGVRSWIISRSERARTVERTRLAERLGQDAKEIEWLLRAAYQLPLHDTRPEREVIRARMTAHRRDPPRSRRARRRASCTTRSAAAIWRCTSGRRRRRAGARRRRRARHARAARRPRPRARRALPPRARGGAPLGRQGVARRAPEGARCAVPRARARRARARAAPPARARRCSTRWCRSTVATSPPPSRARSPPRASSPWLFEARKLAADAAYAAAVGRLDHGATIMPRDARARVRRCTRKRARWRAPTRRCTRRLPRPGCCARRSTPARDVRRASPWRRRSKPSTMRSPPIPTTPPPIPPRRTCSSAGIARRRCVAAGDQRPLLERIAAAAERAVALDPRDAAAWDALGNAHHRRG